MDLEDSEEESDLDLDMIEEYMEKEGAIEDSDDTVSTQSSRSH